MGFIKKFERVILADMIFSLIVLIMAFMEWHSENILAQSQILWDFRFLS